MIYVYYKNARAQNVPQAYASRSKSKKVSTNKIRREERVCARACVRVRERERE